jgi:capsular polysaccharide biosynthesis protein
MNLSQIFRIFRRRWLFMVIPAAIVLFLTILTAEEAVLPPPSYNVGVRFLISPPLPDAGASPIEQERYYQWLTSEYLTNGMADWVNGIGFAEKVSAKMVERGFEVDSLRIFGGTSADAIRSRLTVIMNDGDRDALQVMMESAIEVIEEENASGIPHLGLDSPAEIVLLDRPVVNEVPASIGNQLDLPVRIVLALIVGLLVGFLVEYFDPFIRDQEDVALSGIPILAAGAAGKIGPNLRGSLLLQNPVPRSVVIGGTVGKVVDELSIEVAYSLAVAMAHSGRQVILVDGVLERPLLHSLAQSQNQVGLAESLLTNAPLPLQTTNVDGLRFVAAGNGGDRSKDLVSSPHLAELIASLKAEDAFLIVLAPPPAAGMDLVLLAAQVDAVVLNVECGQTWYAGLKAAEKQLQKGSTKLIGLVVS